MTDSSSLMDKLTEDWSAGSNTSPTMSTNLYANEGITSLCIGAGAAAMDSLKRMYHAAHTHRPHPNDYDDEDITTLSDMGALVYSIAAHRVQQLDAALIHLHDFYARNQKHKPWDTQETLY